MFHCSQKAPVEVPARTGKSRASGSILLHPRAFSALRDVTGLGKNYNGFSIARSGRSCLATRQACRDVGFFELIQRRVGARCAVVFLLAPARLFDT
jgi:hypothetical protein